MGHREAEPPCWVQGKIPFGVTLKRLLCLKSKSIHSSAVRIARITNTENLEVCAKTHSAKSAVAKAIVAKSCPKVRSMAIAALPE